jgi:hypothetical protein
VNTSKTARKAVKLIRRCTEGAVWRSEISDSSPHSNMKPKLSARGDVSAPLPARQCDVGPSALGEVAVAVDAGEETLDDQAYWQEVETGLIDDHPAGLDGDRGAPSGTPSTVGKRGECRNLV